MIVASEFSRPLALDRIGAAPFHQQITAGDDECARLAPRFGIPAVLALSCRFTLRRGEGGRIAAEAELSARLVRECVVTLEEFEADIVERFRIAFVPAGTESDDDPESDDEIPYEGTVIDLGEAAVEQLALTLDPYPHKPGAELPQDVQQPGESPFAALARRRGRN